MFCVESRNTDLPPNFTPYRCETALNRPFIRYCGSPPHGVGDGGIYVHRESAGAAAQLLLDGLHTVPGL